MELLDYKVIMFLIFKGLSILKHEQFLNNEIETKDIQWTGKMQIRPRGQGQWENKKKEVWAIASNSLAVVE